MYSRTLAAAVLAAAVICPLRAAAAAPDGATLLRVFLTDGTSIVSYGEPARVNDRVIFSMPTAATPNPPLPLVNLPAARVDWDRTMRSAAPARSSHYVETQAENDYATLSNDVASTLNEVMQTAEPAMRMRDCRGARRTLADWPAARYSYRSPRFASCSACSTRRSRICRRQRSPGRFSLNLSAFTDPPAIVEPLLPAPTPQQAIELVLTAAHASDISVERTSLLASAVAAIDHETAALPPGWVAATRAAAAAEIAAEVRLDRSYQALSARMMLLANRRAKLADVRGLERVVRYVHQRDEALGNKRPDAVGSLLEAVQVKLDAARGGCSWRAIITRCGRRRARKCAWRFARRSICSRSSSRRSRR